MPNSCHYAGVFRGYWFAQDTTNPFSLHPLYKYTKLFLKIKII